ncbi:MAG: pseudouridine synthase [bacterium]|nr:pseudouridine synthase [Gammaproteobacteria bacterium]HIL96823.1 pseudouridine synthase [Pseudomonadales bacterium]
MQNLILFNKPFGVLCQFRKKNDESTLADFIKTPAFYPAGRLDKDSEGLVLLTNDGRLQARIAEPRYKLAKTYWVQVEGEFDESAARTLTGGVLLKDGITKPAQITFLDRPRLAERIPPVRFRKKIPTSWITITLTEGRNRQVRRMTAAVGFPTLRLFRSQIGDWKVGHLMPGEHKMINVRLPAMPKPR